MPPIVPPATHLVAKPVDPRQAGLFDASLPGRIKPCLPTLVEKPPFGPQWIHEIKWDGYRVSVTFADGKETIRTRNGHNWTKRVPAIVLKRSAILLSEEFSGPGANLFKIACEHELEEIVSKRLDRPYRFGRRLAWQKTKCVQSDTFVIIGYRPRSGAVRSPIANIKVATFDGTRSRYAGAVGRGFNEAVAASLRKRLDAIVTTRCPLRPEDWRCSLDGARSAR